MPYYIDNAGLIGTGKLSSLSGIYDTDYSRLNSVSAAPIVINFASDTTTVALPGTQAQYLASPGTVIPASANYAFNAGYHYFDLPTGTYNVTIKGAEGSGNYHGRGASISAVLVVTATSRFVALVGNHGSGNYGAGGMTALALTNSALDQYTSAIPVLVAGGGGGGYNVTSAQADGGQITDSSTTRRGEATDGGGFGVYDAGAAFYNEYAPTYYSNNTGTQGSISAQHFVWGGLGGRVASCGNSSVGGFGGGGGGCPGGGGGYFGGKAGGNSPNLLPGGGGTSYRLSTPGTAYISSWQNAGYNGFNNGTYQATSGNGTGGFLSITPA